MLESAEHKSIKKKKTMNHTPVISSQIKSKDTYRRMVGKFLNKTLNSPTKTQIEIQKYVLGF
jgi:hypothetical protein